MKDMKDTPTFAAYMMRYINDDSPQGDLARDIAADESFPKNTRRYESIRNYLLEHNAHSDCLRTFVDCFDGYSLKVWADDITESYRKHYNGA